MLLGFLTGENIPRSSCTQGWLLRQAFRLGAQDPVPAAISPVPILRSITDKGYYILDNKKEDIMLWSMTGYRFVKRQSQSNPNVWVSLGEPQPAIATATKHISVLRPRTRE